MKCDISVTNQHRNMFEQSNCREFNALHKSNASFFCRKWGKKVIEQKAENCRKFESFFPSPLFAQGPRGPKLGKMLINHPW